MQFTQTRACWGSMFARAAAVIIDVWKLSLASKEMNDFCGLEQRFWCEVACRRFSSNVIMTNSMRSGNRVVGRIGAKKRGFAQAMP